MSICIIPARSKSVRIKNKNIINFFGKPIIAYAIDVAKKSKLFKRIIVSTDSKKIAKIAIKYGAEVPFLRSKKLSGNYTTTTEVIIDTIKKISSKNYTICCCIYPTAVLINKNDLILSCQKIKKLNADLLIAIAKYDVSPLRSFEKKKLNWIEHRYKKYAFTRSQDLEDLYYDTGSFYLYKIPSLLRNKNITLSKKITYFEINSGRSADINYPQDLQMAKAKYTLIEKFNK
jgi:pseudaminic acid cytidylyltransferase